MIMNFDNNNYNGHKVKTSISTEWLFVWSLKELLKCLERKLIEMVRYNLKKLI